jgi:hypothetical protein
MIHHVERCRFGDFAARAGSCTDASFSAVFRYPEAQDFRGPAERGFFPLPRHTRDLRPARARWISRPAALLGFGPSQV